MSSPANEHVVARYFAEVIDGHDLSVLDELFDSECCIHRADLGAPLVGLTALRHFLGLSHQAIARAQTTFLKIESNEDCVMAHLRHDVKFHEWIVTPVGPCHAKGREVTWTALAMFHLRDGRIIEERVVRDEVSILKQLEMLPAEWFASEEKR